MSDKDWTQDKCRVCGCSDLDACVNNDGLCCYWVEDGLCSFCHEKILTIKKEKKR